MHIVPAIIYLVAFVGTVLLAAQAVTAVGEGEASFKAHAHHRDADPATLQLDAMRATMLYARACALLLLALLVIGGGLALGAAAGLFLH